MSDTRNEKPTKRWRLPFCQAVDLAADHLFITTDEAEAAKAKWRAEQLERAK